jgi:phage terminase large subunit GpA-like protein
MDLFGCWRVGGRKMECWLPLTDRIIGDMRSEAVWKALLEVLTCVWLDAQGNGYRPVCSAIDVQGETDIWPLALSFVKAHGWRCRLKAVRGYAPHEGRSLGSSYGVLRNIHRDKATGVPVQNVDVNLCKTQLMTMLARKNPRQVHIPTAPDGGSGITGWHGDAIEELNSEYLQSTVQHGYTIHRWHKRPGQPNHRLDCFVYALAALAISRLKIDDCEIQRTEARYVGKQEEQSNKQSPFGARKVVGYPADLTIPTILPLQNPHSGFGAIPGSGIR